MCPPEAERPLVVGLANQGREPVPLVVADETRIDRGLEEPVRVPVEGVAAGRIVLEANNEVE